MIDLARWCAGRIEFRAGTGGEASPTGRTLTGGDGIVDRRVALLADAGHGLRIYLLPLRLHVADFASDVD